MASHREVLHPLMGQACPHLGDMLARADYDTAPVLEAAACLAHHRFDLHARAGELRAEIMRDPWEVSPLAWELPPRVLMPADVARALVAVAPTQVSEFLFANLDCGRASFDAASDHWRTVLHNSGLETTPDLPLLRPWARRYSWWFTHGSAPITLAELMGNCVYKQFSQFVEIYREGLITCEEAQNALLRELMASKSKGGRLEVDIPRAYFNRGDLLATLEDKLAEGPGAVLIGEAGWGRSSLLRACQRRHRRGDGPPAIAGFGFNIDRAYELPNYHNGHLRVPPEVETRCVFALVHLGIGELLAGSPADRTGGGTATGETQPRQRIWRESTDEKNHGQRGADELLAGDRAWQETLEYALKISGAGPAMRLVLGVTRAEYRQLVARVPGCAALPVIELPSPTSLDRVMFWMCRVFELEEAAKGPVSLAQILWWLSRWPRDAAEPGIDDLIAAAPRGFVRAIAWAHQTPSKPPAGRLRRALDRLRLSHEDFQTLLDCENRLFATEL